MIFDINVTLGHYPFRALRHNSAETLVALMTRSGIDRALVASLPAVFYRDTQLGNEELLAATKAFPRQLIPVATINPRYVGWERDLADSVRLGGVKAVTLVPEYHGYTLSDAHGRAALDRIAELGLPLVLRQRFEDRRQRHAWDRAEDLTQAALLDVARVYPNLRFVLVNWIGLDGVQLVAAGLRGRCLIDFARLHDVYRKEVSKLIASMGVESIAFGSHAPFDYVGASLVKLANVEMLRPADYEAIAWRNAARFLGL